MKRIVDQFSNESISADARDYFFNHKSFNDVDLSIPKHLQSVTKWWVKFLVFFFFFLIIPLLWYFNKRKELAKYLNSKIKVGISTEDFNDFFKSKNVHFDNLDITFNKHPTLVDMRNTAVASFPVGSIIDSEHWTPNFKLTFYRKYEYSNQKASIQYHYYRTTTYIDEKGRLRTTNQRFDRIWSESIIIGKTGLKMNGESMVGVNFKLKNAEKIKLENRSFNKDFKVYTNDKVAATMIFTPLAQEEMIKQPGVHSFYLMGDNLMATGSYFGGFNISDDIQFSIKTFKGGVEEVKEEAFRRFVNPLLRINDLYRNILSLPIWEVKGK